MPTISGSLKYVTSRPAAVTEVWVRASRLRTSGDGVVTSSNDRIPVADGQVSFDALPGPAVLALVESGRPVETIPLIVGDADEQSLQLVVNAGQLAESDDVNVLEQLAQQVANDVVRAQDAAEASSSSATAARTSETNAKTSETNSAKSEENAKNSETNAAGAATTAGEEADRAKTEADRSGESADAANVSKEAAESASTNASEKAEQTNGDREASESAAADAKSEADRAKTEADRAKEAADQADGAAVEAVTARVNTLLEGAPEAYDTLREVGEKLAAQDDVASAMTAQIGQKADTTNTYGKTVARYESGSSQWIKVGDNPDYSGDYMSSGALNLRSADSRYASKASTQALTDGLATRVEGGSAVKKIEVVTAMPSNPVATTLYLVVS